MPENAGRKIAAFQILDMLGYNPSYIELYELIEGIGLKLDRARFAVTLLAAILAVNATPAQPAESMAPQTLNKSATPKEYQPVNIGFSKVTDGSYSIETTSAPGPAPSLSIEAPSLMAAPLRHSESAQGNTTRSSRGQEPLTRR